MNEILVAGMGKSGEWAVRLALDNGFFCYVYDDRDLTMQGELPEDLVSDERVEIVENIDETLLSKVNKTVISPGFGPAHPVREMAGKVGQQLISEIEFASGYCKGRVFAVTGSNGKTTVTGLTAHILETAGFPAVPCGNFGTAFSKAVLETGGKGDFVVELSSFQLEHVKEFRPDFAALLNLTPDHLDRYPEVDEYYVAKMAMFRNMDEKTPALLNGDDRITAAYERFFPPNTKWIGQDIDSFVQIVPDALVYRGKKLISLAETRLRGLHNLYNAGFCAGMCLLGGVSPEKVREGIISFHPIPHRLENVGEKRGIQFYNDSKATNFDSVVKALSSFSAIHWIAGGRFKGGDFGELAEAGKGRVIGAYFIGESASRFMKNLGGSFPCRISETLEQAVSDAWRAAKPGEVILLAPGCSSYDQFKNYEIRGDRFREIANAINN
ncbi:MAG: UDP-N-acetylmuramoyl-L-alanine--D-glutamate ligase [Acidobacteria bacterium]|nr:MAG: UDP-N-acetylmuramoyl-L-alanine--D-glutamate ligase [Acidobacteriota bacterium]